MVAVELDGGVNLLHDDDRDRDRDNYAQLQGWIVLAFTPKHLKLGLAIRHVGIAIQLRAAQAAQRQDIRAAIGPELFPAPAQFKAALSARR